ncbi:ATP-grasp domain-containing protein [Methylobacterium oryzihabitans]|uniref:ATP-grasp domain-containing protein n=1 Tax=Methylobacterium oryzihabitans TaxID=2499852 RepID=A0A437P6J8_9HYPH|nr:ATP-grasp domain-containing protein [Methylobacterium oryzihabitans]RVU17822.1 ATP-grasp domain-containing protein [Methylobacterium oryzihabitans]
MSSAGGDAILIAAQAGRALAEAARRADLRPYVADLFGDEDTRALSAGYRRVPGRFGSGPGGRAVRDALDALAAEAGAPLGLVLGSGFEGAPGLMAALAGRHRLLGAAPSCVAALKDPLTLAALCVRLGLPHPEIRLAPVADPSGWLDKAAGASGGGHVRPAAPGRLAPGRYLQRRVPGAQRSLALLSDGHGIQVLGATEQWTAPSPRHPFRYAGALAPGALDPGALADGVREAATAALATLAAATGLRGLASADLMVDGPDWWLLEVNPRPGATLDVLDRRATPLMLRHVEAALGRLSPLDPEPPGAAASEIVYAARAVPAVPALPRDGVADRPAPGSRIPAGAPVCTVRASGADAGAARRALTTRAETVRAVLAGAGTVHPSRIATGHRLQGDTP